MSRAMRLFRQILLFEKIEFPIEVIDYLIYCFSNWTGYISNSFLLIRQIIQFIAASGLADLISNNKCMMDVSFLHIDIIR